jgi:branched-subunit amino acid ABC-type transport system permease component
LEVRKVVFEIATVTILAFLAGGINIVYHIEQLPLMAAISAHGIALYLDYMFIYLINGWLGFGVKPFLVFTVCFFVGYALVLAIIYLVMTRNANRLNQKLAQLQKKEDIFQNEK